MQTTTERFPDETVNTAAPDGRRGRNGKRKNGRQTPGISEKPKRKARASRKKKKNPPKRS